METKLVNVVFIADDEYEKVKKVEAVTTYLPGKAKPLEGALVCYRGYSSENMRAMSEAMRVAKQQGKNCYVYEFMINRNSDQAYIFAAAVEDADFLELSRCDASILETMVQVAAEKGLTAFSSLLPDENGKRIDRAMLYQVVAENPEIFRVISDHPWFENKKSYVVPYENNGIGYSLAYLLDSSVVKPGRFGATTTKLKLNDIRVIEFPDC